MVWQKKGEEAGKKQCFISGGQHDATTANSWFDIIGMIDTT